MDALLTQRLPPTRRDKLLARKSFTSSLQLSTNFTPGFFTMVKHADLSANERAFILEAIGKGVRLDGRSPDQLRPLDLTFGEEFGHVNVRLGKTSVLVRTSAELTAPRPERSSDGIFTVSVELNDMALPGFETGRQSELEVQLSRTLDKVVRRSNALDTESLCIAKGTICWNIRADVHIVDCDGGLVDACCVAIMAGLLHFRLPESTVRDGKVTVFSLDEKVPVPLNLTKVPLAITFSLYDEGKTTLVDATMDEETVSEGCVIIALDKTGELALYTKQDGVPADPVNMVTCSSVALNKVRELNGIISKRLEEDKLSRDRTRSGAESSAANER